MRKARFAKKQILRSLRMTSKQDQDDKLVLKMRSRHPSVAPIKIQIARASHSYPLKCPGMPGTSFIEIIISPTSTPTAAMMRSRRAGPIA